MFLVLKILFVALLHFVVFVCYPETGPNGTLYLTMPQLDKVSVLEKVQKKQFPDRNSINMGPIRFVVQHESSVKKEIKNWTWA